MIRFLLARNNNAAEIHGHLCEVYGLNVMSDSKVRQLCRLFKEGRTNVHDEERSGRPSVITDDLVEKVSTTIVEIVTLQFSNCPLSFHSFQDQ